MNRADGLTRTNLQLDGGLTAAAAAALAATLRRVPGVLLAEVEVSGHIALAHDGAVQRAALVAGAQSAGGRVAAVRERAVMVADEARTDAALKRAVRRQRLRVNIGLGMIVAIGMIAILVPNVGRQGWLLLAAVYLVWALAVTNLRPRRRPPT